MSGEPTPVRFRLHFLGHPRVVRASEEGEEEVRWRIQRALLLVAFLALAPARRASKDELIDALWPWTDADKVDKNFHPTVSTARRGLRAGTETGEDPIAYAGGLYRLAEGFGWEVDVDLFRERIEAGRSLLEDELPEDALERWHAAWRLYRGPLLQATELPWLEAPREELHRAYLALLRDVGGLCRRLDRTREALDAYRTLLVHEPFEERAHVAVMELYRLQGRRDLVRRQYVRLQEILKELQLEPMEETQARFHELMG